MKAILLIDHGSRRGEANAMLGCMAHLVQHLVGESAIVRYAHMEIAEPSIERGFADCVAAGATEVVAFPYMLSPGKHSTGDIPRMVVAAAAGYPGVTYRVTAAFGVHEKLGDIILDRAGIPAVQRLSGEAADCCWSGTGTVVCGDACRARTQSPDMVAVPGYLLG
jgi:sirohydrochlorin ferrochelatase